MGKDQNLNAFSNTNEDRKYSKHDYQIVEGTIKNKSGRYVTTVYDIDTHFFFFFFGVIIMWLQPTEQLPTMPQALSLSHMHACVR